MTKHSRKLHKINTHECDTEGGYWNAQEDSFLTQLIQDGLLKRALVCGFCKLVGLRWEDGISGKVDEHEKCPACQMLLDMFGES